MSNEELKPCPFCGSSPEYFGEALMGSLTCTNKKCRANLMVVGMEELRGLETQWNTRAPITREQVNEWCKAEGMVVVPLKVDLLTLVNMQIVHHKTAPDPDNVAKMEAAYSWLTSAVKKDQESTETPNLSDTHPQA